MELVEKGNLKYQGREARKANGRKQIVDYRIMISPHYI